MKEALKTEKKKFLLSHFFLKINLLSKCTALKHLSLKRNQITTIPASFNQLIHLETINLDRNCIVELPSLVCDWVQLTSFSIAGRIRKQEEKRREEKRNEK